MHNNSDYILIKGVISLQWARAALYVGVKRACFKIIRCLDLKVRLSTETQSVDSVKVHTIRSVGFTLLSCKDLSQTLKPLTLFSKNRKTQWHLLLLVCVCCVQEYMTGFMRFFTFRVPAVAEHWYTALFISYFHIHTHKLILYFSSHLSNGSDEILDRTTKKQLKISIYYRFLWIITLRLMKL